MAKPQTLALPLPAATAALSCAGCRCRAKYSSVVSCYGAAADRPGILVVLQRRSNEGEGKMESRREEGRRKEEEKRRNERKLGFRDSIRSSHNSVG